MPRKERWKRIWIPVTLGSLAGLGLACLSDFKPYHSPFGEQFLSNLIPKVHSSAGLESKQASYNFLDPNFIADAVDIAAPAVVNVRVRW